MRVQSLTLAAAGAALLAPTTLPAKPPPPAPAAGPQRPPVREAERPRVREGDVGAADLLAAVRHCAPVSSGRYRSDDDAPAAIPVCGARGAVFFKADLDIDCDGRPGPRCNRRTDPLFSSMTAFQQSDGRYLSAETLPYIVVPSPGPVWDHRDHGITGGSVAAVIHRGRVQYAVVGDVGPRDIIGEASYAAARGLGIRTDPRGGGVPSGVTYIVFENSGGSPIEDHRATAARGRTLARKFLAENRN
ncbi:glycoside hydrolase family 75 protein [Streptomyces sp. NPDC005551]|uniref:glycoside hydrolase family 75 protein n=1 Tax=unclassified Streptomyces TaxID=2593676 RepID=UPI0033E8CFF4